MPKDLACSVERNRIAVSIEHLVAGIEVVQAKRARGDAAAWECFGKVFSPPYSLSPCADWSCWPRSRSTGPDRVFTRTLWPSCPGTDRFTPLRAPYQLGDDPQRMPGKFTHCPRLATFVAWARHQGRDRSGAQGRVGRMSCSRKSTTACGERVVLVARDHVRGAADVGELGARGSGRGSPGRPPR